MPPPYTPSEAMESAGHIMKCTYTPLSSSNNSPVRTSSAGSYCLDAEALPTAESLQHRQQQQLQQEVQQPPLPQQQQHQNDESVEKSPYSPLGSGDQGFCYTHHQHSSDSMAHTCIRSSSNSRNSSNSSSNSSSSSNDGDGDTHPFRLLLLPSLSMVPPLIHRYTGTSTESLLVGLLCCLINIILYICSGVLTRVLQQQEHQVLTYPQQQQDGEQQQLLLPPCPPHIDGQPPSSAAEPCSVRTPELRTERLRVPYLMVWLPQVCQIIFLFISLRVIRKKYARRGRIRRSSSSNSSSSSSMIEQPELLPFTSQEASVLTPSDSLLHAPPAAAAAGDGDYLVNSHQQINDNTAADTEGTAAQQPVGAASLTAAPEAAAATTAAPTTAAADQEKGLEGSLLSLTAADDEIAATTATTTATAATAATAAGEGETRGMNIISRVRNCVYTEVYVRYIEIYIISVNTFLNKELKYEGIGMLIMACLFLLFLYLVQGWCWSIAVGTPGMSVCSVTAIYSTNSFFIFLFTSIIYKEGIEDFIQIISLIIAAVGVALITYDSQGEPQSSLGVTLSVISSAVYGLFEVLYKGYLLQNRSTQPLLFVFFISGIMGALSLLFMWLPIPILHALGLETFPSGVPPPLVCFLVLLSCLCSTIYNILLQVSLLLLPSPMLVAMCFLLSLPPAAIADSLRGGGGGVGGPGCLLIGSALLLTAIKELNVRRRETETQQTQLADLCVPFTLNSNSSNSIMSSSSCSSSSSSSSNLNACKP